MMSLLDPSAISRLQIEFCQSMRTLLVALCRDLDRHYAELAARLELPVGYFRFVAHAFERAAFSNWKLVGWIEALNDLVYFIDLLTQLGHDRDQKDFAEQLFAQCEENFFENSYLDELFPRGQAEAGGLAGRLQSLCMRLALEVTQESLFFDPRQVFHWMKREGRRSWRVPGRLEPSFERAERAFTIPIGIEGGAVSAPVPVRRAVGRPERRVTLLLNSTEIALQAGRSFAICTWRGGALQWHWPLVKPVHTPAAPSGPPTVGPTLRYGKNREPKALSVTEARQVARVARAWQTLRKAWPEGHAVLELLTSRVVPLRASGVVSFSYRHRPGLSFINCFDRDNLDLLDDLIHENSHHHLNLLLRKHVLYQHDRNQRIFYSPWRRSLRPLRGILHATYTFTMGALLFARLSSWAEGRQGKRSWREAGLTARHLMRARFRGLEEIESVRYSLHDLEYAGRHLKWITPSGARLINQLEGAIVDADGQLSRHRKAILASPLGPSLRRHVSELRQARRTYGVMELKRV
jgi:HEXXH motif-containing protein